MTISQWAPAHFYGTAGTAPIVLICEHASFFMPSEFQGLGVSEATASSHAAGDIGALAVAKRMSDGLGAPLVFCGVSRLLYDCNRPLSAPDCIPSKSEVHEIPGNIGLSDEERRKRFDLIHQPFHTAASGLVETQQAAVGGPIAVVTIHSFTPIYHGKVRELDLGFLFHGKPALSQAANRVEQNKGVYRSFLNQPYDATDGVTHSLRMHGDEFGHENSMIEIRNDLINTDAGVNKVADHLAETLQCVMSELGLRVDADHRQLEVI